MPVSSTNNPYKCIYRDEHNHMGWVVKTQWRGEIRRRRFADSHYGGTRGALAAALRWRDLQDAAMDKPSSIYWIRSSGASGRAGKRHEWTRAS